MVGQGRVQRGKYIKASCPKLREEVHQGGSVCALAPAEVCACQPPGEEARSLHEWGRHRHTYGQGKAGAGRSTPGDCGMQPHYHEGRRSLDASPHKRESMTLHCVPGLELSKWGGAMPLYPERVHLGTCPRAQRSLPFI